jgi:hypothetical protein
MSKADTLSIFCNKSDCFKTLTSYCYKNKSISIKFFLNLKRRVFIDFSDQ